MRIIITGGTGFIGRSLVNEFAQDGHVVTVLSRRAGKARSLLPSTVTCSDWVPRLSAAWQREFEAVDAVINLAGEPIAQKRWTASRRQLIRESRISATKAVVEALRGNATRPCVLVNASGIGYYGPSDGTAISETVGSGSGFLADLCVEWEGEARRAEAAGTRVVRLRLGMVLERDGGALAKMLLPFRFFLGGPIMPGTQWVSWIHRRDVIGLIKWVIREPRVLGAVNAVAPEPVTMRQFCQQLGEVLRKPSWLPVPEFALRAGLGELASVMTTGQRVVPQVALQGGYSFHYSTLEEALKAMFPS